MIKEQVITRDSDAVIGVLLIDENGYLGAPIPAGTQPSMTDRNIRICVAVGKEEYEAVAYGKVVPQVIPQMRFEHCSVAALEVQYIEEVIGGVTCRRLPKKDDAVSDYKTGSFLAINVKIPRNTFESVGVVRMALCDVRDNGDEEWSNYVDTNIVYSNKMR